MVCYFKYFTSYFADFDDVEKRSKTDVEIHRVSHITDLKCIRAVLHTTHSIDVCSHRSGSVAN